MLERVATESVSQKGTTKLPKWLRRRWGVDGGKVAFIDLGNAALVLPGGIAEARAELWRVLFEDGRYDEAVAAIDDPDVADQ